MPHIVKGFIGQAQDGLCFSTIRRRANIERHGHLFLAVIVVQTNIYDSVYGENMKQYTDGDEDSRNNSRHTACPLPELLSDAFHGLQNFLVQKARHIGADGFCLVFLPHSGKLCRTCRAMFEMLLDKGGGFFADHIFKVQGQNISNNIAFIFHVRFPPICFESSSWLGGRSHKPNYRFFHTAEQFP